VELWERPPVLDEADDAESVAPQPRWTVGDVVAHEPVVDVHNEGHRGFVADEQHIAKAAERLQPGFLA